MSKDGEEVDFVKLVVMADYDEKDDSNVYTNKTTMRQLHISCKEEAILLEGKENSHGVSFMQEDKSVPDQFVKLSRVKRNNLRILVGDTVLMKKCPIKKGKNVTLAPIEDSAKGLVGNFVDVFLRPRLIGKTARALHIGDILVVTKCFRDITFKVNFFALFD